MADKDTEKGTVAATSMNAEDTNGKSAHDAEKSTTPIVVDWDSTDDPQNPMNWSKKKKWSTISLVAYITFVTYVE